MKKLPNGISNYVRLIEENYIYVDKTMYLEKLEDLTDRTIMFLRPRKFGKTLFTSTLENYYDILKKKKFKELFKNTYIGKNPTKNRNTYHILRFNFSGIDTTSVESTINAFRNSVRNSIEDFILKYKLDFYINKELSSEELLDNLYIAFRNQKKGERIYVIIDEYDHFANELLGFKTNNFKDLLAKNGKIRKWYEILKKGTETIVDRIFITGVSPITLDSTTSGFNIAKDISKDIEFNEMLGFSKNEVKNLMNELDINEDVQQELLPIIKENYDGYVFSDCIDENLEKYKMYNSNMILYFLNQYNRFKKIPQNLVDINIISDYSKIEGFMNLCDSMGKKDLLEKIVANENIESELTEKFNSEISFGEKELISLLFYLGYLTISAKGFSKYKFKAPNQIIRKIYAEYFLEYLSRKIGLKVENIDTESINEEILIHGKIDKIIDVLKNYLKNLSNRDYQRFDEKYIKVIFYSIAKSLGAVNVKTELEISGKYIDTFLSPIEYKEERYSVMLEFKYIKQEDYNKNNNLLKKKQEEAREQLKIYKNSDEFKMVSKLKTYSIVVIKDRIEIEEV